MAAERWRPGELCSPAGFSAGFFGCLGMWGRGMVSFGDPQLRGCGAEKWRHAEQGGTGHRFDAILLMVASGLFVMMREVQYFEGKFVFIFISRSENGIERLVKLTVVSRQKAV